jgi:ribosomal-protein-alanine N-acetyltransferase
VAYGVGQVKRGIGELHSLAVRPDYRRLGIGRGIIGAQIRRFRRLGCSKCRLEVRVENCGARRMYEGLGFKAVETIPSYYDDGADAVVMA